MRFAKSALAIATDCIEKDTNLPGAASLLALRSALLEVLLEGLALGDGALLAEGVVLSGNGGGVLGVGLGGATPGGIVGHVTGILGRALGEEGGHAAL